MLRRALSDRAEVEPPNKRFHPMPLRVDADGFTRVDEARGHPVTVCLEPKRNAFMAHFLAQLAGR